MPMNTEILTLCRYASNHGGHLSIIDTFDVIAASKFPWREYFYVAAKMNFSDDNENYKAISVVITSEDCPGKVLFEALSDFVRPEGSKKLNIVAGIKGFIFEYAGNYSLNICLDGKAVASLPFKVISE